MLCPMLRFARFPIISRSNACHLILANLFMSHFFHFWFSCQIWIYNADNLTSEPQSMSNKESQTRNNWQITHTPFFFIRIVRFLCVNLCRVVWYISISDNPSKPRLFYERFCCILFLVIFCVWTFLQLADCYYYQNPMCYRHRNNFSICSIVVHCEYWKTGLV